MAEFDKRNGGYSQDKARNLFLRILTNNFPEVVSTLAKTPLVEYQKLLVLNPNYFFSTKHIYLITLNCRQFEDEKNNLLDPNDPFIPLHASLYEWASTFNINVSWVLRDALESIVEWAHRPSEEKTLGNYCSPVYTIEEEQEMPDQTKFGFEFRFSAWHFHQERKFIYKEQVKAEFERQLNKYLIKIENYAKESGYIQNPKQRKLEQHLTWLAQYQVGKMKYLDIVEQVTKEKEKDVTDNKNIDETVVLKAVHKAARLINLPLHQGAKRGRKSKS